jgi:hypothetical protein
LLEADNISRYDPQSNMLLYYLIHEFSLLLKYSQDGFIRTNVCNFLVEFIERIFFRYNTEHLYINNDINRFIYILNSVGFLKEVEEENQTETQGFYEEYVDMDEAPTQKDLDDLIDEEEEREALDLDMDPGELEEGVASAYDRQSDFDAVYETGMIEAYEAQETPEIFSL